jgi:metabotropic glutamate receptor 2/3
VYGALLTKTNRISRIFHSASQSARRPSYISPRSQLIITSILASVQFMGTLIWIMVTFPDAERVYPNRHEVKNYGCEEFHLAKYSSSLRRVF